MLTLKQFKHALLLDEITDFTPYLEYKHPAYLREMVRQGICVEQLSQLNIIPVTILLIETDQAQEHYDEWLEHPNMNVRWALARKGLYPEQLLSDRIPDVRLPIVQQYPRLANNRIGQCIEHQ